MYHPIAIPTPSTPVRPAPAAPARPACPFCPCGGEVIGNGTSAGLYRWKCTTCTKTFSQKTLERRAKRAQAEAWIRADLRADIPGTCRDLAADLDISRETANRWRRQVMASLPAPDPALLEGLREAAVLLRRENRKGARSGTDAARGLDAVVLALRADGGVDLQRLPDAERDVLVAGARPRSRRIRLTPADGAATVEVMTDRGDWRRLDLDDHWRTWFVGNRGPASHNLDPYLRWFATWLTRP